jgi:hypothetical protein
MAKEWWEDAPVAQEKPTEWWKDAPIAQAPAQQAQNEWWQAAPVVKPEEEGFFTGLGKSLLGGVKDTGGSLYTAGATTIGANESVVESAKAAAGRAKDQPQELAKFQENIQKRKQLSDEGIWAGIKNVAGATVDNPEGALQMVVGQLPNTGVALGAGAAGAFTGAAIGSVVPVVGTVIGGTVGFLAGLFTANTALELGSKAQEKAQDGEFTDAERYEAMKEGVVKGATITAVDAATFGASKWLMGTANRAVETATVRAIEGAGIDATKATTAIKEAQAKALQASAGQSKEATTAAVEKATAEAMAREGLTDPVVIATIREAQAKALEGVNTLGKKAGRGGAAVGLESVGEGLGEYLGEYAATGKASPTEAVMEALSGLSMSLAELHGATKLDKPGALTGAVAAIPEQQSQTAPPPPAGTSVQQAAATPGPGVPGIDPARVEQLTQTFVEQGLDPGRAQFRAIEVATREAEDQADNIPDVSAWTDANLTQTLQLQEAKTENKNEPLIAAVQAEIQKRAATQGAENAGQTIPDTSGTSVPVAGQPNTNTPAAGLGVSDGSGVVSAGQDVTGVAGGEAAQPVAVEGLNLTSIPYEFRSQAGQGQPVVTNTGENNIIDYSGRRIALVNINGVQVPFYLSTGSGGKVDVPAGKWYPFFGIGADGWINKTGGKEMAGYYGSEVLRNTAAMLDSTIGDIRNDSSIPKVGAYGAHIDAINTGFTPAENGTNATETTVRSNIDSLLNRLNGTEQVAPQEEVTTESELTPEDQAALQEELAAEQAKPDEQHAEEAPIPDSVANVIGDLTTLPEEEAPTEAVAKGKPGPKGARQTPEQKAASDERRKQQRTNYKQNVKAVDAAEAAFNEAIAPIDEETVGGEKSLASAEEEKRIGKIQAIKSLLLLNRALKGTKLGDRVAEMLKNPAITAQELENIKKGIAAQISKANTQVKVGRADGRFSDMTTGQQALRHVIKTGNAFQKFLAQRLMPFVKGVNFQVIEEDAVLPSQITEGGATEDWEASRGLFLRVVASGERFVFVRGISGGPSQGINNVTVLHEMLHAALNKKLDMADWALRTGFDRNSDLAKAFRALEGTIALVKQRMADMQEAGTLPESMYRLIDSNIFVDTREFVAYAMTDPVFQKFLMETEGHIKQPLLTRFVNNVRQFFNMGPMHSSALADVIIITDKMISSRLTAAMREEIANDRADAKAAEVSSSIKSKKQRVNATLRKIEKGNFADAMREIPTLVGLRDQTTFLDVLNSSWVAFDNFKLQQLLPALQTEALVEWADRLGIKGIKDSWRYLGDMAAMRTSLTKKMFPISEALTKLAAKAPEQFQRLASVMHYSTLLYRDPTKPFYLEAGTGLKREHHAFDTKAARDAYIQANNTELQKLGNMKLIEDTDLESLWKGLTDANKKLYEQARDFYKDNHDLYHQLLEDQIAASSLGGQAANPAKSKLIAQIKQMYEEGKKLYPYFPLMRYGQYWISVGKGPAREFYMFENAFDRNMFMRQRFRQLQKAGETRSLREMQEAGSIDAGNDLVDARKKMEKDASGLVKEMFNAIDDGAKGQMVDDGYGNLVSTGMSIVDIERLKDEIYQMYLQTLPDRNFRRQFMHRQGTTGFTGDIGRNFVVTGTNMANQLARIKYGPKIMGEIERAQASLKGNPDKAKLGEFVTEMRMRAEEQVRPSPEDSFAFQASNFLNQSAYLWLMTSVKTAAAQMTAMPIFVGPVLTSNHGFNPFRVAKEMAKSLLIFGTTGIKRTADDGTVSWEFPSMVNNQLVKLTGDEKLAAQYMLDRGISESTQANDLMGRRNISTKQSTSTARRAMGVAATVMTGLFHHTERMVREVTFMTSYRLYRDDINPDTKKKFTHEEALRLADAETKEALGNYHASNRPRGLIANAERQVLINAHKPSGRAILQFKMFPAFVTTFFMRNAYRMFAGLDAKDRAKAMTQFVGTLTMSTALAGYVGVPGATMAMGAIQGAMNLIRDLGGDDDDDDPLEKRNLEFWFRNIWLPQTFGNVKIGDHTLDEVLDRGLIATMSGYDISSSLSMNNMWFPDVKESATAAATMQEYLMSMMGPGISLTTKQIPQAIDYFNKGEVMRGVEQLAPAFVRGALTAERYEKEGALTSSGAAIKEAEEFTEGQLLAQRFGFATEGLVAQREAIFKLQGEILKVKKQRAVLLDRLDLEINKGDDDDVDKALEKIQKFNSRNPFAMIQYKDVKQSLEKQAKRRMQSDRGMPIDKHYYPQVVEALEPSIKKLERESALNKE